MEIDQVGRLRDIREACLLIEGYVDGVSPEEFFEDTEKQDAVIRRIEIIGEATAPTEGGDFLQKVTKKTKGRTDPTGGEFFGGDERLARPFVQQRTRGPRVPTLVCSGGYKPPLRLRGIRRALTRGRPSWCGSA